MTEQAEAARRPELAVLSAMAHGAEVDAAKVLRAVERGAACKVDLSDGWTPWDVVALPLSQVREQYGIPPLV